MNRLARIQKSAGFTLIEMLIVLLIAAILLSAAVPAYQGQVQSGRMSAASRDMLSNLMSAKSESVARNEFVTVCKRNTTATGCLASGDWGQGWVSFIDADGDGAFEVGDEIIQVHDALPNTLTARATAQIQNRITFRPNGQTHFTGTQTIVVCDENGFGDKARAVVISVIGKVSILPGNESGQADCL